MIQRYRLIKIGQNFSFVPATAPCGFGDYVRYEDYMRIIESIGAGGVKGQLMRKELSDDAVEEIKAMADIRIVDGRAELSNVREIAYAITRGCNE